MSIELFLSRSDAFRIVFGIPLEELLKRPEQTIDGIPAFVRKSIDYICNNEEALTTEGIFRISSSTTALDSYKETIDVGKFFYLKEISTKFPKS